MEAQKFAALFLAFSLLLTVFSAVVLTLVMTIKIREQLPTYAVHLVCGAGLNHIYAYIGAEVLSLLAGSAIIAGAAAYLLTGGALRLLPISLGICGLIGVSACLVPMLLVKKQSLNGRLGRNY